MPTQKGNRDDGATRRFTPGQKNTDTRRKKEEGSVMNGCIASLRYVAIIIGISVLLSGFIIVGANDMFAFIKDDSEVTVTIPKDASASEVAKIMHDSGIVGQSFLFEMYLDLTKKAENIEPGTYTMNTNMDYRAIAAAIAKKTSAKETVTVTIPEGMTEAEIFTLLETKKVCSASKLAAAAADYDFNYSWVKTLEKGSKRLEGYLFPDTYTFYVSDDKTFDSADTAVKVINKFLSNFNKKYDVDLRSRAAELDLSMQKVIIVASMIEKEAKLDEERPLIASVIYNRLNNDNFPYLQIDATVQYALPAHKEKLSNDDLKVDSPYNTYTNKGLPPGAICNPGLAAITAALYPEDTTYYYYVAKKDGSHIFSKTQKQHEQAIAKVKEEG